eukprot:GHVU01021909.1.p1 GENE.GHVU01021909.1~~GHVU01021909.1.p1  ORF type:complete len:362 (+),score=70.48 GHVU01021909.1:126-1211(+)
MAATMMTGERLAFHWLRDLVFVAIVNSFVFVPLLVTYICILRPLFLLFNIGLLTLYHILTVKAHRCGWAWDEFSKSFWMFRLGRTWINLRLKVPPSLSGEVPAATGGDDDETTEPTQQAGEGGAGGNGKGESNVAAAPPPPPQRQVIVGVHPHGVLCDYRILFDGMVAHYLKGITSHRFLVADVLLRIPAVREVVLWTHGVSARKEVARDCLRKGLTLFLTPGGEREQLQTARGEEAVYLLRRKGFLGLAAEHKLPVVPCYAFGVSDLYRTSSACEGLRSALVRYLGVCLPLFVGRLGCVPAKGRHNVTMVFGEPIDSADPLSGAPLPVELLHDKYVEALKQLYEDNKREYGDEARELHIH